MWLFLALLLFPTRSFGQQTSDEEAPSLAERQRQLAERYTQLEAKLFDLYEYELSQNPDRSELLKRAFELSQNRRIASQLEEVVRRLEGQQLKPALDEQAVVLKQLQAVLLLLQNEDAAQRREEERRRLESYLAEVERLMRIQQSVRGQTEGGVAPDRLADTQQQAAARAARLAEQIRQDQTPALDAETGESDPADVAEPSAQTPSTQPPSQADEIEEGESAERPPSDSASPSSPNQQTPSPSDEGSSAAAPPAGDASSPSPVQQSVERAQERMRDAQQRLKQAQAEESVEAMRQAEAELARAKRELEEILRQLRDEEIEQTLQALEARFREMLEEQQKVVARTERLNALPVTARDAAFQIEAGKLSGQQQNVALEADRLLLILQEEGSAIAFPETLVQIRDDMEEVARRLRDAEVGPLTLALEEDIVLGLQDLLNALIAAQEDQQERKQQQSGPAPGQPPGGGSGEPPLINQLEELKLIRNLQVRINRRHTRYSQLLEQPDDPVGYVRDPELQRALEELAERQDSLREITRELIQPQGGSPDN